MKSENMYVKLFHFIKKMNKKKKIYNNDNVEDSHDVIAYLMILMNYYTALDFIKHENGIFRMMKINEDMNTEIPPDELPHDVQRFMILWRSSCGAYIPFCDNLKHEFLKLEAYSHITSPIRRLVDLLNMLQIQHNHNMLDKSENNVHFLTKWTTPTSYEYINTSMRSIRKIQNECALLHLFIHNDEVINKNYDGYVFDRVQRNDYQYLYHVYIPELKLFTRYTSNELHSNYQKNTYKLYMFNEAASFKRKIKIMKV
jgi:hypothetical protein